ncbi:hypothetical protein [Antrihabitans stalactiti]|uniref:Uncharacterized protein n=1 Tax=Antrihabitans stalactiti TaxID=2584121 RepID=A0A848KMM5_9NOCA|nr:hypothetical protein [Antrihabitans stalactiti]NMN99481.1 hypothetical protein [Antrihabitans stalactiti]
MRIIEGGTVKIVPALELKRDTTYLGVQHLAAVAPAPAPPQDPPRPRRYPASAVPTAQYTSTLLRYDAATGELVAATRSAWTRADLPWAMAKLRLHRQTQDVSWVLPASMRDQWAVALLDPEDDDDNVFLQIAVVHPIAADEADVIEVFELSARLAIRRQWSRDLAHERSRLRLERTFAEDRELRLA